MRVLQILEACGGGTGRHVLDICRGLTARGVEVHLIYSPLRIEQSFNDGLEDLCQLGVNIYSVPMRREINWQDFRVLFYVLNYVSRCRGFNIIHGHSSKAGGIARLIKLFVSAKVIYTPNGFVTLASWMPGWKRGFYGQLERVLTRLTDVLIAVSDHEYDEAVRLGYAPSRLRIIPNGISLNYASPFSKEDLRAKWGFSVDEVIVGFLGRLDHQKNPELLLSAFAQVRKVHPKCKLVMVGDGPLRKSSFELSKELGVESDVIWLGYQRGREILPLFDIFVLPSDYEGFPYVLLEAMQAGLPIVATDVGGVRMAIEDGVNGFVVPKRDIKALAERLSTLATCVDLRLEFGNVNLARIQDFGVDQMVDRLLRVYHSLV